MISPYSIHQRQCPPGTVVYGGGGFFHQPGSLPNPFSHDFHAVYASMPTRNGWFFGAYTGDTTTEVMTHSVRCLPNAQIPIIRSVTNSYFPNANDQFFASGSAQCPVGFHAYSGGAWWHTRESMVPSRVGYLKDSRAFGDAGGWYATGNAAPSVSAVLSVTVRCTSG